MREEKNGKKRRGRKWVREEEVDGKGST